MNSKEQEFFVDAGVVAQFLGVARETVRALARRGRTSCPCVADWNETVAPYMAVQIVRNFSMYGKNTQQQLVGAE